ncbi:myoD family inhibitor isoform X2 [Zootoca vivipara]|uniref:myoD family inhibitor isoform X2 n=1 Tax=Zootoca vivipara TaxID=8524 RepID=UPI00158FC2B3|nr:myoD family inhibitor isoform X2 [Zootoca vivipara]
MSQVRREPSSRSDSLHGDPQVDPAPFPSPSAGQDTNMCPSSMPNSAVAPTAPNLPTSAHHQTTDVKEENPSQEHSASCRPLVNGTAPSKRKSEDGAVAREAITRQPQSRVTVRTPPTSTLIPLLQNGAGHVSDLSASNGEAGNGALCSELSSLSGSQKPHRKLQSHHSINSQISKKSKGSSKSASSQIPTEAQEDCCVHCILSCLFCEFLTLCNIMLDCATCGSCSSEDSCICCCCCGSGECADCDLPCDMDCGIIDACCESADCLEICMECCGLCFSS